MAAFIYKFDIIENYDDDAATEAALNAEGINSWEMRTIDFQPNESTGKSTATVLYKRSSSSSSVSSSSSSLSSSSSSLSVPGPLVDNMDSLNTDNWVWTNVGDYSSFTGGKWVRTGVPSTGSGAFLESETKWLAGGDYEFEVDLEITGMGGGVPAVEPLFKLVIEEPTKGGSSYDFGVRRKVGTSVLEWYLYDGGSYTVYDVGAGTVNSKLRVRHNANNTLTYWVWDNSQWEWNGNTDGLTTAAVWDENVAVTLAWNTSPGTAWAYLNGAVDRFWMKAGTLNVV